MLAGCGTGSAPASPGAPVTSKAAAGPAGSQSPAGGQAAAPPAITAAGDIPDTTVYVPHRYLPGHFLVKVPEGWSRQASPAATFASDLNSITAARLPGSAAPTVATARAGTVPALRSSTAAFSLTSIRPVTLAAGPAIEIVYEVNSAPNAVTGRRYRLVVERFELFKAGRGAALSLSSAVGSDNVDPWRIVSESFRWL